jgi:putative membrane protein
MNVRWLVVMSGALLMGAAQARTESGSAGAPNDAQIAAVVVAANQAEIDTAKVASTRATNADVKELAATMTRDHTAANQKAKQLVGKLKLKPQPSEASRSLTQADKKTIAELKKLKGAEFDKAYVDHEVAFHQQVLDDIDSTLLPNAKDPELRGLLEKVKPGVQAHLDHAKQLQSQLASGGAAASGAGGASTSGTGSGASSGQGGGASQGTGSPSGSTGAGGAEKPAPGSGSK